MQRYAGRTLTAVWHSAAGHETRLKAQGSRQGRGRRSDALLSSRAGARGPRATYDGSRADRYAETIGAQRGVGRARGLAQPGEAKRGSQGSGSGGRAAWVTWAGVGLGSADGPARMVHEGMRRGRLGLLPVESVERAVSARCALVMLGDTCSTPPSENQCRQNQKPESGWTARALSSQPPCAVPFFLDFFFSFFLPRFPNEVCAFRRRLWSCSA